MENLHDVHKAQLARFTQWFAQKRASACSDRDGELEDFKSDRLVDEGAIFNYADVQALLNDYHLQVIGRVREELESTTNLSAVYIAQLLAQAEASGMALQVEDISAIEDHNKIGEIGALRVIQTMPGLLPKPQQTLTLAPLGGGLGGGGSPGGGNNIAMLTQIQDLEDEKRQLLDRNGRVEAELTNLSRERAQLSHEVQRLHEGHASTGDAASAQVAEYHRQLMQKQDECEAIRRELAARLQESVQFRQLKDILQQKNAEVKAMAEQMRAAGLMMHDAGGGGVELLADDD